MGLPQPIIFRDPCRLKTLHLKHLPSIQSISYLTHWPETLKTQCVEDPALLFWLLPQPNVNVNQAAQIEAASFWAARSFHKCPFFGLYLEFKHFPNESDDMQCALLIQQGLSPLRDSISILVLKNWRVTPAVLEAIANHLPHLVSLSFDNQTIFHPDAWERLLTNRALERVVFGSLIQGLTTDALADRASAFGGWTLSVHKESLVLIQCSSAAIGAPVNLTVMDFKTNGLQYM